MAFCLGKLMAHLRLNSGVFALVLHILRIHAIPTLAFQFRMIEFLFLHYITKYYCIITHILRVMSQQTSCKNQAMTESITVNNFWKLIFPSGYIFFVCIQGSQVNQFKYLIIFSPVKVLSYLQDLNVKRCRDCTPKSTYAHKVGMIYQ